LTFEGSWLRKACMKSNFIGMDSGQQQRLKFRQTRQKNTAIQQAEKRRKFLTRHDLRLPAPLLSLSRERERDTQNILIPY
jgi:hypothetical protein